MKADHNTYFNDIILFGAIAIYDNTVWVGKIRIIVLDVENADQCFIVSVLHEYNR